MKKISNRGLLNRYNNHNSNKKKEEFKLEPEIVPCPSPIVEPKEVIEEINDNQNSVSDEMVEIYKEASTEPILTFKELVQPPEKIPTLKLIVEKILLEKKLERINGWIRR
jgi:hypothetical protein